MFYPSIGCGSMRRDRDNERSSERDVSWDFQFVDVFWPDVLVKPRTACWRAAGKKAYGTCRLVTKDLFLPPIDMALFEFTMQMSAC